MQGSGTQGEGAAQGAARALMQGLAPVGVARPAPMAHAARTAAFGTAAMLAWLLGTALQLQRSALEEPRLVFAALGFGLALGLVGWRWRAHAAGVAAVLLAVATLAYASTTWRAAERVAERLAPSLEGVDLLLTGRVAELPRVALQGTRFVFEVEAAERVRAPGADSAGAVRVPPQVLPQVPTQVPPRVALGWYRGADEDTLLGGPAEDIRAGQRWRLPVRLKQPHGAANPHGFDVELWMFERGIGASGTVRSRPEQAALKLDDSAGHAIERARQDLRDAIARRVADPAAAGVLAALAIGDQAAIDRDGWDLFRTTGVAHLMSISGLHVTMFAWLAGAAVGWLWRRWPRLLLLLPAPLATRWGGLVAAAGYALLAGWGVPAQRTVWMIALVVLLKSAGLRWPLHRVLLAAAVLVCGIDPWALLQPGFWLSFVAVAMLVASEPATGAGAGWAAAGSAGTSTPPAQPGWRARTAAALRAGLRTQLVATIGLAPLTLVFFQQLSLVGFVANLVAIPLVTLLVTPLALLGVLLPPLWLVAAALVQGLTALLQVLAALPWAIWTTAAAPPWAMTAGLLGGALAVLPLPWRLRLLAVPLVLPLLLPPLQRPPEGEFELLAADIGQGSAVIVQTRYHVLLYDTGPAWSAQADAGARILVPLLRARGHHRLNALVLSHRDTDHTGGAASVLAAVPTDRIVSSLVADHPLLLQEPQRPHTPCRAGQGWVWDGVRFELLHPAAGEDSPPLKPNAVSCVLKVTSALTADGSNHSALLAGDIEAAQEQALVQRAGDRLKAQWLLVPHHGSRTSSTPALLAAVQPEVAVVQAAYRSRFGHPAPTVVARYEQAGIALVRTDRCGAHTWRSWAGPPSRTTGVCEREANKRYWHHPGAVLPP